MRNRTSIPTSAWAILAVILVALVLAIAMGGCGSDTVDDEFRKRADDIAEAHDDAWKEREAEQLDWTYLGAVAFACHGSVGVYVSDGVALDLESEHCATTTTTYGGGG